jgi:signal transduction histidine kinase
MSAVEAPRPAGLELGWHVRTAGRTLLFLLLGVPYGIAYLVLAPVAAVARRRLFWQLAELERRQANRRLDAHMPPVPRVHDRPGFYRALTLLVLKLPVTLAAIALAAVPALLVVALLALGVEGLSGEGDRIVGPWTLGPLLGVALCLLAIPAAVIAVAAQDGVGALLRRLTRALLRTDTTGEGPVREMLAERLGDERGHKVSLPGAGSGRAWTAVEREGQRVAAIVHDAELDASPELVHAAASAALLALDNERLKADLRARLEELRHSRRRIVDAADDARRRIERDLHDGAQQQLVSLALDLRLLRARLKDRPDEAATVEELAEKLNVALAELRELARGIHPAVLSDHGLAPAIHVLVERASIPVECDLAFEGRLAPPIEAAAYFVVAEGLTNVVKYANAKRARVSLRKGSGWLDVVVADDGVGGAHIDAGSGLRGLSDRLAALEGELMVDSPLGEGTRLGARIRARGEE